MFKITLLLLPFFSLPVLPVCAQTGREVVYRELGISFHVPEGWNGEERDEAFLMSSPSEAGLILLLPHEYRTLAAIREEAERGIRDEGISLHVEGPLETLGEHGLGGRFSGMLSGRMARAYIVGLINPHGQGFSIMAAADTASYSDRLRELALAVAGSTRFFQPESTSAVQYWKTELQNIRLYWSYSSTSRVGGYSGMSETEEIWLCGAGYFHYKSSSHNSFDSGGAFGYGSGRGQGAGTWEVVDNGNGGAVLLLRFQSGEVRNYPIQGVERGKLNMGGYKYFYSRAGDKCP